MGFSVLRNATDPYTRLESWFYDTFVGRGLTPLFPRLDAELALTDFRAGRVLDVGCGGGQLLGYLAETRPEARVAGIDLSPDQVARARRRLAPFGARCEVREASALSLPYADAAFDFVLSVGSVKHWPDREKGLSECVRVLAPGGRLIVAEAERGCNPRDVDGLFALTPIPRFFRAGFRMFFLTYVAGPSLSSGDFRALFSRLALKSWSVRRISGLPVLVAEGIRS